MKKLLFISVFCFSFSMSAQSNANVKNDKIIQAMNRSFDESEINFNEDLKLNELKQSIKKECKKRLKKTLGNEAYSLSGKNHDFS